jgi:hypothetical protein
MKLRSLTPLGRDVLALCSEVAAFLFPDQSDGNLNDEIVVITPHTPMRNDFGEESGGTPWQEIHHAWQRIQSSQPRPEMNAWRVIQTYGQEIAPGCGIFHLRNGESPRLFCLLPEENLIRTTDWFIGLLSILSSWWHIRNGRGLFHAAGITCEKEAYLFVGPSGAGKSTVSQLSVSRGYSIIHDDHVVVYQNQVDRFMSTDSSLSKPGVPVKHIFFLIKDTANHLVPLSPLTTTKELLENLFEYGGKEMFYGQTLRYAFATSAAIARSVPGYELHFRKSPDFWDVIDAELGN